MLSWADLLVGLLPLALTAFLIWLRVRAAGASTEVAVKFIATVFVLVAATIFGLGCVAKGWREGSLGLMVAGVVVTVASVFALRKSLQRMWEKFPLPSNGNDGNNR